MILLHVALSGALALFDQKSLELTPISPKNYVSGKASKVARGVWTTKNEDGVLRVWTIHKNGDQPVVVMLPTLPRNVASVVSAGETGKFLAVRTTENKLTVLTNVNGTWSQSHGLLPEADSPSNITIDEKSSELLVAVVRRIGANGALVNASLFRVQDQTLRNVYHSLRIPFGKALRTGENWFGSSENGTFRISASQKVVLAHQGYAYFLSEPGVVGYLLKTGTCSVNNKKYSRPVGNSRPTAFFKELGLLWGSVFDDQYWIGGKSHTVPEPGIWLLK